MSAKILSAMSLTEQPKMIYHIAMWPASYNVVVFFCGQYFEHIITSILFIFSIFCLNNILSRRILIDCRLCWVLLWFEIFVWFKFKFKFEINLINNMVGQTRPSKLWVKMLKLSTKMLKLPTLLESIMIVVMALLYWLSPLKIMNCFS